MADTVPALETIPTLDTTGRSHEQPREALEANRPPDPAAYGLPPRPTAPIPNGWYAALGSDALGIGEVRSFIAVERELVAYRTEAGTATVIDAHCPHLGAHLGGGIVVEESIKCPYHGWRFGTDGECTEVPYSENRVPAKACTRTYPVREQDGFVFFWYHAGGAAPTYEIPAVAEVHDPAWSDAHVWEGELEAGLADMAENNVDYAHLKYVHRRANVPLDTSTFTTDGPFARVVEQLPEGPQFTRDAWGPGVALLRITDLMTIYTTTTPIGRRHVRLRWHFFFPKAMEGAAASMIEGVTGEFGLQADVPIWRDKVYVDRPVLVKGDGHLAEFRRWYAQFSEGTSPT